MSSRLGKKGFGVILGLLIACFLGSLLFYEYDTGVNGKQKTNKIIKVGYLPITLDLPFFVAAERFFKNDGLNVKPIKFSSSNLMVEALINNSIDVITSASITVVYSIEQNVQGKIKVFMVQINTSDRYIDYILVKNTSNIKDIAQLKGKKVGVFPGSTALTYARLVLDKLGVNPHDVNYLQLPPTTQIQALDSGQVDALMTWEPIGTISISKGISRSILKAPINQIMDPLPGGVYAFSNIFVQKRPDDAGAFVRSMNKAVDYIRTHPLESKNYFPKWTNIPEDLASKINIIRYWKQNEIDNEIIQKHANLMYKNGELYRTVNTSLLYY